MSDIERLLAHNEINNLINAYNHSLDSRKYDDDWAKRLFTPNVSIVYPTGTFQGFEGVKNVCNKGILRFKATEHIATNIEINIADDCKFAHGRFQCVNIHVVKGDFKQNEEQYLFVGGGRCTFEVIKAENGWRIDKLNMDITWTQGERPAVLSAQ